MKKNELQRHKKSDKIKWTLTAITFILFAVLLAGVCLQVFGNGKANPSEWFKTKTESKNFCESIPIATSNLKKSASSNSNISKVEVFSEEHILSEQNSLNIGNNLSSVIYDSFEYEFWFSITLKIPLLQILDIPSEASFSVFLQSADGLTDIEYGVNINSINEILVSYGEYTPSGYPNSFSYTPARHNGNIIFPVKAFVKVSNENVSWGSVNGYGDISIDKEFDKNHSSYSFFKNAFMNGNFRLTSFSGDYEDYFSKNTCGEKLTCYKNAPTYPLPPNPTKEGHTFSGWYYGTQLEHGENCRAYDGAPIYENMALHAHFNINRYTVIYDVAGGTPVNSMVLDWNTVAEKPTVSRTGYNFVGWFLPNGTQYTNQPIKADTTLTARWEIKTFTVTFYVGEEKHAELTVEYGTALKELTEEAQALNLQVLSIRASNGAPIDTIVESGITEDLEVQAQTMTGADKVKNTVKNNWLTIALSAGGGIVVVVFFFSFFFR